MTEKEFFDAVTQGSSGTLAALLDALRQTGAAHCVIGGLAVNAYAEPVVSLDLDLVIVAARLEAVAEALGASGFRIERFAHSVNLSAPGSDLRIQLQTDPRYQAFIPRAEEREVLGHRLRVAAIEDVLQGKLWAYQDTSRRPSKRQKDLADIARLVEIHPELAATVSAEVRERIG